MQALVEDFLQYLRHERGQPVERGCVRSTSRSTLQRGGLFIRHTAFIFKRCG